MYFHKFMHALSFQSKMRPSHDCFQFIVKCFKMSSNMQFLTLKCYINWTEYWTRQSLSHAIVDIKRTIQHDNTKHLMQIRTTLQQEYFQSNFLTYIVTTTKKNLCCIPGTQHRNVNIQLNIVWKIQQRKRKHSYQCFLYVICKWNATFHWVHNNPWPKSI